MRAAEKDRLTLSVCLSVCLSNYGGKSHVVNPFFADVSRASRFCASIQTPRKSGLARRCPHPSFRTLRRLATPRSPDNSAPRQRGIVRYNKFTIDTSAIQGFCVNPLYLFWERVKKIRLFSPRTKHFSENLAKTPCSDCSMGRGGNTGVRTGARKRQAMQSGTHFAKTGGFRSHGTRLFHACWGAAPIPAEDKSGVAVGKGNFWRITACLYRSLYLPQKAVTGGDSRDSENTRLIAEGRMDGTAEAGRLSRDAKMEKG